MKNKDNILEKFIKQNEEIIKKCFNLTKFGGVYYVPLSGFDSPTNGEYSYEHGVKVTKLLDYEQTEQLSHDKKMVTIKKIPRLQFTAVHTTYRSRYNNPFSPKDLIRNEECLICEISNHKKNLTVFNDTFFTRGDIKFLESFLHAVQSKGTLKNNTAPTSSTMTKNFQI